MPEPVRLLHPLHRSAYFADPQQRPMGAGMALAGRRRDGTEFPAEISLSSIETDDGLLVSAPIRDVTERVEANEERERLIAQAERERYESRLGRSQRLESLGQLAGGVAHDFNNLLAVILNYTAFVAEEIGAEAAGGDPRWVTLRRDVEHVQDAGQRAAQLTQQLLAFGRREVVHPEVRRRQPGRRSRCASSSTARSVSTSSSSSTSTPQLLAVLVDPGRLEQALVDLAVNARDAMTGGGRLLVTTANQLVDDDFADPRPGLGTGPHVVLQVIDTGCGMDAETQKRAFEPFFTTKAAREGAGLGLATVYGFVSQADGYIEIASDVGVGSVFTLYLPATEPVVAVEPVLADRIAVAPDVPRRGGRGVDARRDPSDPRAARPPRARGGVGGGGRGHRRRLARARRRPRDRRDHAGHARQAGGRRGGPGPAAT